MTYPIRIAVPEDAEVISRLSGQLGYPVSVEEILRNLNFILALPNETVYVALHENIVVGWIYVFQAVRLESGSVCEIGGLIIDDHYRNRGIGKLLVEKAKQWCRDKFEKKLRVRSNVKRVEAHRFYKKLGFDEIKQQKAFELVINN